MTTYACLNPECSQAKHPLTAELAEQFELQCFKCERGLEPLEDFRWEAPEGLRELLPRLPLPIAAPLAALLEIPTTEHHLQRHQLVEVIRRLLRFLGLYMHARYLSEAEPELDVDRYWKNQLTKASEGKWVRFIKILCSHLTIERGDPLECFSYDRTGLDCEFESSPGHALLRSVKDFRNKWAHGTGGAAGVYEQGGDFDQAASSLSQLLEALSGLWEQELVGYFSGAVLVARGPRSTRRELRNGEAGEDLGHVYLVDPSSQARLCLYPGLVLAGALDRAADSAHESRVLMFLEQRRLDHETVLSYVDAGTARDDAGPRHDSQQIYREYREREQRRIQAAEPLERVTFKQIKAHAGFATDFEREVLQATKKVLGVAYVNREPEERHLTQALKREDRHGGKPLTVLTAPAGSGKTALLDELAGRFVERRTTLLVRCVAMGDRDLVTVIQERLRVRELDRALEELKAREHQLFLLLDGLNEHPRKAQLLEELLTLLHGVQGNPAVRGSLRVLASWRTEDVEWVEAGLAAASRPGLDPRDLLQAPPESRSGHLEGEFTSLHLQPWVEADARRLWEELTKVVSRGEVAAAGFELTNGLTFDEVNGAGPEAQDVLSSPLYMRLFLETHHAASEAPMGLTRASVVGEWLRGVEESLGWETRATRDHDGRTFLLSLARAFLRKGSSLLEREELEEDVATSVGFEGGPFDSMYARLRDRRGILMEIPEERGPQVNFSMDIFFQQIAAQAIREELDRGGSVETESLVGAYQRYRSHPLIEGVMRALLEQLFLEQKGEALLFRLIDHQDFEEPKALGQLLAELLLRGDPEWVLDSLFEQVTEHDTLVLVEALKEIWSRGQVDLLRRVGLLLTTRWGATAFGPRNGHRLAAFFTNVGRELGADLVPREHWDLLFRECLLRIPDDCFGERRTSRRGALGLGGLTTEPNDQGLHAREAIEADLGLVDVLQVLDTRVRVIQRAAAADAVGATPNPRGASMVTEPAEGEVSLDWQQHLLLGYLLRLAAGWPLDGDSEDAASAVGVSQWSLRAAWEEGPLGRGAALAEAIVLSTSWADWMHGRLDEHTVASDRTDREVAEELEEELGLFEQRTAGVAGLETTRARVRGLYVPVLELKNELGRAQGEAKRLRRLCLEMHGPRHPETIRALASLARVERRAILQGGPSPDALGGGRQIGRRIKDLKEASKVLALERSSATTSIAGEVDLALGDELRGALLYEKAIRSALHGNTADALADLAQSEELGYEAARMERLRQELELPKWVWSDSLHERREVVTSLHALASAALENQSEEDAEDAYALEDLQDSLQAAIRSNVVRFEGTWEPDSDWLAECEQKLGGELYHFRGDDLLSALLWWAKLRYSMDVGEVTCGELRQRWSGVMGGEDLSGHQRADWLLGLGRGGYQDEVLFSDALTSMKREERALSPHAIDLEQVLENVTSVMTEYDAWRLVNFFGKQVTWYDSLPMPLGWTLGGTLGYVPHAVIAMRRIVGPSLAAVWEEAASVGQTELQGQGAIPEISTRAALELGRHLEDLLSALRNAQPEISILCLEACLSPAAEQHAHAATRIESLRAAHGLVSLEEKNEQWRIRSAVSGLGGLMLVIEECLAECGGPYDLKAIRPIGSGGRREARSSGEAKPISLFDEGPIARIVSAVRRRREGTACAQQELERLEGLASHFSATGVMPADGREWLLAEGARGDSDTESDGVYRELLAWCALLSLQALATFDGELDLPGGDWLAPFRKSTGFGRQPFFDWTTPLGSPDASGGVIGREIWDLDRGKGHALIEIPRVESPLSEDRLALLPPESLFERLGAPGGGGVWLRVAWPHQKARWELDLTEIGSHERAAAIGTAIRRAGVAGADDVILRWADPQRSWSKESFTAWLTEQLQPFLAGMEQLEGARWMEGGRIRLEAVTYEGSNLGCCIALGEWHQRLDSMDWDAIDQVLIRNLPALAASGARGGWLSIPLEVAEAVPRLGGADAKGRDLRATVRDFFKRYLDSPRMPRLMDIVQNSRPAELRVQVRHSRASHMNPPDAQLGALKRSLWL